MNNYESVRSRHAEAIRTLGKFVAILVHEGKISSGTKDMFIYEIKQIVNDPYELLIDVITDGAVLGVEQSGTEVKYEFSVRVKNKK